MVDLVLIDDDVLIHGTWKMVARTRNHNLLCCSTIDEFLNHNLPKEIAVYLDFHFNSGDNGVELAKILYQKGYKNLYITTGSAHSMPVEKPAEIIAVLGKEYPLR
jgi:hypothetical protein